VTMRFTSAVVVLAASLGLNACSTQQNDPGAPDIPSEGLAVNGYLWRASLDTLEFMPMVEANPSSGALITDWYADPEVPDERMKVSVFIMGTQLRSDILKVVVVRQKRNDNGIWVNESVKAQTKQAIEEAILARARQLRIDSVEN